MADETYLDHLSRLERLRQSRDPRERLRQVHAERRLAELPELAASPPRDRLWATTPWERLTTPLLDKPAQPGPAILHHLSSPLDIATIPLAGVGGIIPKRHIPTLLDKLIGWRRRLGLGKGKPEKQIFKRLPGGGYRQTHGPPAPPHWTEGLTPQQIQAAREERFLKHLYFKAP